MLAIGSRIGPYELLSPLGAGGMGEVYRAKDLKLGREVAIKILPDQFSADPDRLARFQREAQVLASLNHPNIAAIYGLEDSDGTKALVLELVPGETLADRISRGPIPLDEALPIAKQIAEALEAAHEQGIIHRDLKPANIKITRDGVVKVLDFGLAKLAQPSSSSGMSPLSMSPTITSPAMMTGVGVLLGTAPYMSPEQAKGREADKRSDVWAFGCVFYEMLTGKRAFDGEDVADTIAKILQRDPDWDPVPHQVRRLLQQCLQKDRRKRLRDIGDAELLVEPGGTVSVPTPRRRNWGESGAIATLLIALAGLAAVHFRETPATQPVLRFEVPLPAGTNVFQKFALSPDGRKIAFFALGSGAGGRGAIYVRSFDSTESRKVVDTLASPSISWSPDGRFLLYPGGDTLGMLFKVDASGGSPQAICDIGYTITGSVWTDDGQILFGSVSPGGIWRVSSQGGKPTPVTTLDATRRETGHSTPVMLPDGKHFLYERSAASAENAGVYIGDIAAASQAQSFTRLIPTTYTAAFVADPATPGHGFVVFRSGEALLAQWFDVGKLALEGTPTTIADHVGNVFEFGNLDVAGPMLAYRNGGADLNGTGFLQVMWFDATGKTIAAATPIGLFQSSGLDSSGSRIAVTRMDYNLTSSDSGRADIWVYDRDGHITRLTTDGTSNVGPAWSPKGDQIAYAHIVGTDFDLMSQSSSGGGTPKLLLHAPGIHVPYAWSPRGDLIYVEMNNGNADLFTLSLRDATHTPLPYLQTPFNEGQAQFSPSGDWVAYMSDDTGRPEVYVRPFPNPPDGGGKVTISTEGGMQPRWSRDGRTIYYLGNDPQSVMAVSVKTVPNFVADPPRRLFNAPSQLPPATNPGFSWDVSPDGKRFLLTTNAAPDTIKQAPISIVMNWSQLMK